MPSIAPIRNFARNDGLSWSWQTRQSRHIEYIKTVRSLVAEAVEGDRKVTASEQEQIITQLEQQYTDYKTTLLLPDLQVDNVKGIAQELQQN